MNKLKQKKKNLDSDGEESINNNQEPEEESQSNNENENFDCNKDGELQGLNYYRDEIENFISQYKDKDFTSFYKEVIFAGTNYINKEIPLDGWGKKQHFLFFKCGGMFRNELICKNEYDKIEKIKELSYYTITIYKGEHKNKNNDPLLTTLLHLYLYPQKRLSIKYLSDWILLNQYEYRQIENMTIGAFANEVIHSIFIKILNENLLPKDNKNHRHNKTSFINYLNDKIKNHNEDNPEIQIL